MIRLLSIAMLIRVVSLSGSGCHPNDPPKHVERPAGPGPGDSLAKLLRLLLVDPDPVAIAQAITCEHGRLGRLYGEYRADSIAREVEDTIYSRRDQDALRRADAKLANHVFYTDCGHPLGSDPVPRSP